MALRSALGCLALSALAFAAGACKDKGTTKKSGTAADLEKRCETLAASCGDKDTHAEKITTACKAAIPKQVEAKCIDAAIEAYDCYQKELCGGADKVWALDDFRVLVDRHQKCMVERERLKDCAKKK